MNRENFRRPDWMADWKIFLLFSLLSFAFAFGLRCLDLPKWDNPAFMVNGEYIMGTHDAYYWLAGAKGVGSAADHPMAGIIRTLGAVTGAQYGNIAFWLPAVFAGLTAVAALGWGTLLAGNWAGLACAVFATCIPSYFYRTRLAYYDTDVVTLLFPLLISVLLARWMSFFLVKKWFSKKSINFSPPNIVDYLIPFFAGLLVWFGHLWHPQVTTFALIMIAVALFLSFSASAGEARIYLLRGLLVFSLPAFCGLLGAVAALVVLYMLAYRCPENRLFQNWLLYAAAIILIALLGMEGWFLKSVVSSAYVYLKPASDTVAHSAVKYPGIAQSVIEAQNIEFENTLRLLSGNIYLSVFALCGFILLLLLSPLSLLLFPFFALAVSASFLGGRFGMFGGIVIGIGAMSLCLFILSRIKAAEQHRYKLEAIICTSLLLVFGSSILPDAKRVPVTPIMNQMHAQALIAMGKTTPPQSMFWTWWDWGYATMYYAERRSFADGGNHGGEVLYPLAIPFSTPSPTQANQIIRFSAASGYNPAKVWNSLGPEKAMAQILSLGLNKYSFPKVDPQYLVVSWENVRLAYWILYYGSWNVETKVGIHPNVTSLLRPFSVNTIDGKLLMENEFPLSLSRSVLLEGKNAKVDKYAGLGPNLLFNRPMRQGYLVDDFMYSSMLMQLLICDSNSQEIVSNFRLVYENFPFVRVYEVLQ